VVQRVQVRRSRCSSAHRAEVLVDRNALEGCKTVEDIELLLRKKGQQWMSLDVEMVDNEGED
jgi:hypothetical protein